MAEGSALEAVVVGDGFTFLESPRWRAERLFVSDFHSNRVLSFDPSGNYETVCTVVGEPGGLGFDRGGDLLVLSKRDCRLLRLSSGELREVANLSGYVHGALNDMVVDSVGRAYIGNVGYAMDEEPRLNPTVLLRVDPDGAVTVVADDLIFPNGMVIADDGASLIVAETFAGRITAFEIDDNGGLDERREWATFAPAPDHRDIYRAAAELPVLPDGIALDAERCLWVGDAKGNGAIRVREGGEVVDRVDTSPLSVYAVALGDTDRRTLYLCAAPPVGTSDPETTHLSELLACRVDVPAAPGQ